MANHELQRQLDCPPPLIDRKNRKKKTHGQVRRAYPRAASAGARPLSSSSPDPEASCPDLELEVVEWPNLELEVVERRVEAPEPLVCRLRLGGGGGPGAALAGPL